MSGMSAPGDVPDIQLATLPRFKRAHSRVNVFAEHSQFLNVMQHLPPDVLLIGRGQPLYLRQSFFECLRHGAKYNIMHRPTQ
jgi:hypothetical protein